MKFLVVHLEAVPSHVHGYVSRFLVEVTTGLYVGPASSRVEERLWGKVCEAAGSGRAVLVAPAAGEPGYVLRLHNVTQIELRDFDGLLLPAVR